MAINAYPNTLNPDSSGYIVFQGLPHRELTWSVAGSATLTNASTHTNAQGLATAVLTPTDDDQTVTVSVAYVS